MLQNELAGRQEPSLTHDSPILDTVKTNRQRGNKTLFHPTQMSMKSQLLIKIQMLKNKYFSCFLILRCHIYHAYNVEIVIVGIFTFMSEHDKFDAHLS